MYTHTKVFLSHTRVKFYPKHNNLVANVHPYHKKVFVT